MIRLDVGRFRGFAAGACALGIAVVLPAAAAAADAPKTPTFTKDIAPIFQDKCESCHRRNQMAPMSLVAYEEVRPWVKSIEARVSGRQMPPWHIDKTVGIQSFKNDRSLSDSDIAKIVNWVDGGAQQGDAKDLPKPINWPDPGVWQFKAQFGEPDIVMKSAPYSVNASGQDKDRKSVV